ncbi:FG-GAP-like repeat-containing protein [Pseudanabaena sp. FACHB-2040]|uniref:beta strand repeat-containing protein n=1 Tax=Pseudanabaena sp. FACHB-2040 TaxID=2692859 RepID=UPI0016877E3A|nr:FG-GAP-like repeat-containing protein [Pseudanabaena sp. FACHB-2040]MBD2261264.1 FG-GAP repeat protein [Pseudanabaena sp. FACHB-2040]
MGVSSILNLASLDGSNGFIINGIKSGDRLGKSVSEAGDINGDGFADLIIGAPEADPSGKDRAGESYVIFGSSAGFSKNFDLTLLNGINGFVISGPDSLDRAGRAVGRAGDLNGDGFDDLVIGSYYAEGLNGNFMTGRTYVVFGRGSGFSPRLNLAALDGDNGFVIHGIDLSDRSGTSVTSAGDFNGDGIDDLIIGADGGDPNGTSAGGESYLIFGSKAGFAPSLKLADLNGQNGFVINGVTSKSYSGNAVSSAGDINGDGFDDLIIAADRDSPNGVYRAGVSYVVFGSDTFSEPQLNLSTLNGTNGFAIHGIDSRDQAGFSISSVGDFNGDGIDDLVIGAYYADPQGKLNAGESYVVFGSRNGFGASLNLALLDGTNGFVLNGIDSGDRSGFAVSGAGDINGDGFNDIIIGAPHASGVAGRFQAGESYIIFGSGTNFGSSFNLSELSADKGAFIRGVKQYDLAGFSVSAAGDINGDGVDDIVIGAPSSSSSGGNYPGDSYVIFGQKRLPLSLSFIANATKAVEGAETGRFTLSRGTDTYGDLQFIFDLSGSASTTDYNFSTGTVSGTQLIATIPHGQTSVEVIVTATDDTQDELTEFLNLTLSDPSAYDLISEDKGGTFIFEDNDLPKVSITLGFQAALSNSLNLGDLDSISGFTINGIKSEDRLGTSVSGAGDINGDGIDDLIISAPNASPSNIYRSGQSYVVFGSDEGFGSSFNPSSLNGSNGFIINGTKGSGYSGSVAIGIGDINGDGFADIFINEQSNFDNGSRRHIGRGYVVFGSDKDFSSQLNLNSLDGTNGFLINGGDGSSRFRISANKAGDINGDGLDDFIVGASQANSGTGASYIIFGRKGGLGSSLNLATLDGTNGFAINGTTLGDLFGSAVSSAGDINGDGISDLIIGAPGVDGSSIFLKGAGYVVFGSKSSFGSSFNLSTLDGNNGFFIERATSSYDSLGSSVSSAGDINGDGIDDLIISAPNADLNGRSDAGTSYVVFGSRSGFSNSFKLSSLNGKNGFVIGGTSSFAQSGRAISAVGDVNNDGIDDIIIRAPGVGRNTPSTAGQAYVVFGSQNGFKSYIDLSVLNGSDGFFINGINSSDSSQMSVSGAGDINGDGIADFIVGVALATPDGKGAAGTSYVVFGSLDTVVEGGSASFFVLRSNGSLGDLDVLITIDGTVSPNDYHFDTGTLNGNHLRVKIPDGQDRVRVTISTTDDGLVEGNETLTLSVTENGVYTIGTNSLILNLKDNDTSPALTSITRQTPIGQTTAADSLIFRALFNRNVQDVSIEDFAVTGTTATITNVTQVNPAAYDITVFSGNLASLNGTVGLNLANNQDITDLAGNVLFPEEPTTSETYRVANFEVPTATNIHPRSPVFTFEQYVQFQALDEELPPDFDEELYLLANPDIKAAVNNGVISSGFQHYSQHGASEGRSLLPLTLEIGGLKMSAFFDETYYLSTNPDIAKAVAQGTFAYGFEHFLLYGVKEGRSPSNYYNEAFYLQNNPDIKAAVNNGTFSSGLMHYLQFGHVENRIASELFNPRDYLRNNPDVQAAVNSKAFTSGFEHYLEWGAQEGKSAGLLYEEALYLRLNPDVASAVAADSFISGYQHYVSFGQKEGRISSSLFNEGAYLSANSDVAVAVDNGLFSSGMEHFFRLGRAEGRAG